MLTLRHDLIFATATVTYRGASVAVPDVLIDTGAASTVIDADLAAEVGIYAAPDDELRTLRGVGGREVVFVRRVDRFAIGAHGLDHFDLEVGAVEYGFGIRGIIGMDFLRASRAVIDLGHLTIAFGLRAAD